MSNFIQRFTGPFRVSLIIFLLIVIRTNANAEIAILPYRVQNPQDSFNDATGTEYAMMMGVLVQAVKRGITVTSPRDVNIDMKKFRINPQETISADELVTIGSSRKIDYFILGSISKTRGGYSSESVLFAVKDKRKINSATVKGANLYELVERDMKDLLRSFKDRNDRSAQKELDVLFLIDGSYNNHNESKKIKESIVAHLRDSIDGDRIDTRAYVIPFSSKYSYDRLIQARNSVDFIENKLQSFVYQGKADQENFEKTFSYGVNNIRWRQNSIKNIIIITNSAISRSARCDRYAAQARRLGVKVSIIAMGRIYGDNISALKRISDTTRGALFYAAYHQGIFDAEGRRIDLYLYQGRLFSSHQYDRSWKTVSYGPSGGNIKRIMDFASEVFMTSTSAKPAPATMKVSYESAARIKVIRALQAENNLDFIIKQIKSSETRGGGEGPFKAKVLLTDGSVSLWMRLHDKDHLEYFKKSEGRVVMVGISIADDSMNVHGLRLIPRVIGMRQEDVPKIVRTRFEKIIKEREYFARSGIGKPPIWFINVKIDAINEGSSRKDIRDAD